MAFLTYIPPPLCSEKLDPALKYRSPSSYRNSSSPKTRTFLRVLLRQVFRVGLWSSKGICARLPEPPSPCPGSTSSTGMPQQAKTVSPTVPRIFSRASSGSTQILVLVAWFYDGFGPLIAQLRLAFRYGFFPLSRALRFFRTQDSAAFSPGHSRDLCFRLLLRGALSSCPISRV